MGQHQVLGDELDVHHAAGGLLEIELSLSRLEQVIPHLLAHLPHFAGQGGQIPLLGQHVAADAGEFGDHGIIAIDGTGSHQGLMLPGPGFLLLVLLIGRQR